MNSSAFCDMQEKVLEPELLNPYAVADYYDTVDLTMYLKSKSKE